MILTDLQIIEKLLPIENKIKANPKRFSREHLNRAIQLILYNVESFDKLIQHISGLLKRAGVRLIGIKTLYTPRADLEEIDKTNDWIKDVLSYDGVRERFNF